VKNNNHPQSIKSLKMKKLIEKYFLETNDFERGELICFYDKKTKELMHDGILLDKKRLFHQSGTGGLFDIVTIEGRIRVLEQFGEQVKLKSYKIKQ
jgi:hypothetical protein